MGLLPSRMTKRFAASSRVTWMAWSARTLEVLATIYAELGKYLGDIGVASWGVSAFFKGVDEALKAEGFGEYMTDLCFAGAPLAVPLGDEPSWGFCRQKRF